VQGLIDYTLAKRAVLEGFRRGSVDRLDICDAHPQLIRAAQNIGAALDRPCPVCAHETLRQVRYVYGEQLKHLSGRPVYPENWELELAKKIDEFRCYSVEVCADCGWNHLESCYLMGRRYKPTKTAQTLGARTRTRRRSNW